jgi:arginine decarboxylase
MNCLGLAKKIAIVSGFGESNQSKLNAFDNALIDAGIHDCNLIKVSSILAKETKIIDKFTIEKGSFVPCVMSPAYSNQNETTFSGIAVGFNEQKYGFVVEGQGSNSKELEKDLNYKLDEMASSRKLRIVKRKTLITGEKTSKKHGCCVTAVVYLF